MRSEDGQHSDAGQLRKKAEQILQEKASRQLKDLGGMSPEETRQILHELQVHQIELEIQNEELRLAQSELEAARSDREKLRTAMYSINSISMHRPSCPHCANNLRTAHRVLGQIPWPAYDAARAGQGASDE